MKDAIGGYAELELRKGEHYHKDALKLNTARNCLEYILKVRNYKKVYIPYYTCEVVLEPFHKHDIAYEFYAINAELEPQNLPNLAENEAFLYTNYYGVKQSAVNKLAQVYGNKLIVDNSQAFYAPHLANIDTFYSARKFFGVPDGAYLYISKELDEELEQDISWDRMLHLLKRADINAEVGYKDSQLNNQQFKNQPIKRMSKLTEKLLASIDYQQIKKERKDNFALIHNQLKAHNKLSLECGEDDVPMAYPLFIDNGELLRKALISQRVFVPMYWNNVLNWCDLPLETALTKNMLALPIVDKGIFNFLDFIKEY